MGRSREPVRIVVAEPSPRQGGGKLGTVEALRRIGRGVRIEVVHDGAAEAVLRDLARSAGCRTLFEDGARLVADGTTSLDELLRVGNEG